MARTRQIPDVIDDNEIQQAAIRLNDALCSFERATGREFLLLILPFGEGASIEETHLSMSGKPIYEAAGKREFLEFNLPRLFKKI